MSYGDTEPTFWPWRSVSIQRTGGPERVTEEVPPEGWTPPAPVGFAPPRVDGKTVQTDPLLWEGDGA